MDCRLIENITDNENLFSKPITSTVIIDLNDDDCDVLHENEKDIPLKVTIESSNEDLSRDCVFVPSHGTKLLTKLNKSKIGKRKQRKSSVLLPTQEPFLCPYEGCGKISRDRLHLRRHYRNHQERKHACQYCEQKFLYLKDKRTHERSHTGERPFICQVCKKSFIQKCTLTNHLITHSKGEKREVCDLCGRSYYYKKSLAEHKKEKHGSHFGKDFYLCPLCGKKYLGLHGYNLHVEKCSGKKPSNEKFVCSRCCEIFKSKNQFQMHLEACNQSDSTIYQCGVCDVKCSDERQVRAHMDVAHSVMYDACVQVKVEEVSTTERR